MSFQMENILPELDISNCYFTGDCYKMFKNQCSWLNTGANQSKPDYYSDINVAACDFSISNNISVFSASHNLDKEALYFGNCTDYLYSTQKIRTRYYDNNENNEIALEINFEVITPFCEPANPP